MNNKEFARDPQSFYDHIYNEWLVTKVGGLEIFKVQKGLRCLLGTLFSQHSYLSLF